MIIIQKNNIIGLISAGVSYNSLCKEILNGWLCEPRIFVKIEHEKNFFQAKIF